MTNIDLSKKALLAITGRLSDEELEESLASLGAPVESVTKDSILCDLTPNRPDWLSEAGLGRALASYMGKKQGLRQYKAKPSQFKVNVEASVAVVRPFTSCAVIKGIKWTDDTIKQIIQMQEKLHGTFCRNRKKAAIGIYPMEKIAWPITYKAEKPDAIRFVPLDSSNNMTGWDIVEKHPAGKAYGHLLNGAKVFPVFRDASGAVLSMPPLINSSTTGRVTTSTKDVFIECSGFDQRFLDVLLNIIVAALIDMGGEAYQVTVSGRKTPTLATNTMPLDINAVNKRLGLELKEKDMQRHLERMGHGYAKGMVTIPCYRADILHPVDLMEDIAIAYGYHNVLPAELPLSTIGRQSQRHTFTDHVAGILVGFGLLEANTYHLTSDAAQTTMMNVKTAVVPLANALTAEYNCLRNWLLPCMLEILKANKHHDYPQRLFTHGTVFSPDAKAETGIGEAHHLSIISSHATADYTELRQVLDYLCKVLKLEPSYKPAEHPSFIPGRCAELFINSKRIGLVGELHPAVLEKWEINLPTVGAELDLDALFAVSK